MPDENQLHIAYPSKFKWTNKGISPRKDVWSVFLILYAVIIAANLILSPFFESTDAEFWGTLIAFPLGISLLYLYARRYREIKGDYFALEKMPAWKHRLVIASVILINSITLGIAPLLWFGLKRSKIDDSDEYNELPIFTIMAIIAGVIILFGLNIYEGREKEKREFIASSFAYKHETYKIYTDKMSESELEKFSNIEVNCREKGISFEQRKDCMYQIIEWFDYYLVKVNTDSLYLNTKYRDKYDNRTRFLIDYGNYYHITQMNDYTTFIIDYWEVLDKNEKIKAILKDKIKTPI